MKAVYTPQNSINTVEVEQNYFVDNYLDKSYQLGYSIVRTRLNGKHPLMKNIISNRTYYFITGQAKFNVDGEDFIVNAGDMLTIPKDTKYKFEGKFEAILISSPAFEEKYDVIYKKDEK